MFGPLKDRRRVATRSDSCPRTFVLVVTRAAPVRSWSSNGNSHWPHIHICLADGGIQSAEQSRSLNTTRSRSMRFDLIHEATGIGHCQTKPKPT
jgi:hypothetical protein